MSNHDSNPSSGPDLPEMPSLPENAADRAKEVLDSIGTAFADGVRGLGETLADLLPQAIGFAADLVGVIA
jgi:hypothetical protein